MALLNLMSASLPALAEQRIALQIGNEAYAYAAEIGQLADPHNDVALLQLALKGLDFDVAVERDAGLGAPTHAVNAYARRLQPAGPNALDADWPHSVHARHLFSFHFATRLYPMRRRSFGLMLLGGLTHSPLFYPAFERPVVALADDDVNVPPIVGNERLPERCEISRR
jgi:hypothetical protein